MNGVGCRPHGPLCTGGTVILPPESPDDPSGNTVGGVKHLLTAAAIRKVG